jgi:hypothetical protein
MLVVLCLVEGAVVCETLAAGALLRRHGRLRAVLLPYAEVALTATTLIFMSVGLVFQLSMHRFAGRVGHVLLLGLLVLAVAGILHRWPVGVRALLHLGWLGSIVLLAVTKPGG